MYELWAPEIEGRVLLQHKVCISVAFEIIVIDYCCCFNKMWMWKIWKQIMLHKPVTVLLLLFIFFIHMKKYVNCSVCAFTSFILFQFTFIEKMSLYAHQQQNIKRLASFIILSVAVHATFLNQLKYLCVYASKKKLKIWWRIKLALTAIDTYLIISVWIFLTYEWLLKPHVIIKTI